MVKIFRDPKYLNTTIFIILHGNKNTYPLEKLNKSNYNNTLTYQGIVTELSPEFEDNSYGFIQTAYLQSLKNDNQQIGVQHNIYIILSEKFVGLLKVGDKVRITGTVIVRNVNDRKSINKAILAEKIKILNNEELDNLTDQEIKIIETFAKEPLVQQNLANFIFNKILINPDIILFGTLILFCADSPDICNYRIPCNLSLLIVGKSGTFKTSFLNSLEKLLPNNIFHFSQKSETHFITYNSSSKKGDHLCEKAGLADLAKDGIILIDNLGELKEYKLSQLNRDFKQILRKSSIIAAVHTKYKTYDDKKSIYQNLQFPRKNFLLKKFDLVLIADSKPAGNTYYYRAIKDNQFSKEVLRKYIKYAKNKFDPRFTKRAGNQIIKFQEEMVKINNILDIFKLTRVLTLLSKAYARIALKNTIELKDVQIIIRIYKQILINLDLI